jgi:hypothetical protein
VALFSDGARAVTSGYDGKVTIWSLADKKPLASMEKRKGWCSSIATRRTERRSPRPAKNRPSVAVDRRDWHGSEDVQSP